MKHMKQIKSETCKVVSLSCFIQFSPSLILSVCLPLYRLIFSFFPSFSLFILLILSLFLSLIFSSFLSFSPSFLSTYLLLFLPHFLSLFLSRLPGNAIILF